MRYDDNEGICLEDEDLYVDEIYYDCDNELWTINVFFYGDPNEYFNADWFELGYESYDQFQEEVDQWITIHYDDKTDTYTMSHIWDAETFIDGYDMTVSKSEKKIIEDIIDDCRWYFTEDHKHW